MAFKGEYVNEKATKSQDKTFTGKDKTLKTKKTKTSQQ